MSVVDEPIHSYLHCRQCLPLPSRHPLELGITRTGLLVSCLEHGPVVFFTPDTLAQWIARGPQCECCRRDRRESRRPRGRRPR
jgi:hypothetical protein